MPKLPREERSDSAEGRADRGMVALRLCNSCSWMGAICSGRKKSFTSPPGSRLPGEAKSQRVVEFNIKAEILRRSWAGQTV